MNVSARPPRRAQAARLDAAATAFPRDDYQLNSHLPVLFVVEGPHDVQFLRRISRLLHADHPELPDLVVLELQGQLVFLPLGDNAAVHWSDQLCRLGKAQIHLYDREMPPETKIREAAVQPLRRFPNTRAFLTSKRSLENYLHPELVSEICGVQVEFGDNDSVADTVARRLFETKGYRANWESLTLRTQKRLRARAKRWLNTLAIGRMTVEQLRQRDPQEEVAMWLGTVAGAVKTGQ